MLDQAARRGALCLLVWSALTAGARGEQIVKLEPRPGVQQFYLLLDEPGETYQAAVLFFPGTGGELELAANGMTTFKEQKRNFLELTWRGSKSNIVVAIMDAPSDLEGGFTYAFRADKRHMTDISAIVRDLKARFPGIRVFLIGLSAGTFSVAYAGSQLGDQLAGVVSMASIRFLGDFDFSSIKAPVLFVHHVDDECVNTPYATARRLARGFPFISVSGGKPPESGPCGPRSAHTFFGRGRGVAAAIADWMFDRPFPRQVR